MGIKDFFRRKSSLDDRIILRKEDLDGILTQAREENRFSLFEFYTIADTLKRCEKLNDPEQYEFFYDIAEGWDKSCHLSRETGEYINRLMSKQTDSLLAIHRTDLGVLEYNNGIPTNDNLHSIMKDGLINNGHALQGGYQEVPSLSLTTTPLNHLGDVINLVGSYKNNNIVVLLQFPKDLVNNDLSFKNRDGMQKIYKKDGSILYIQPEYILGAIVKNDYGLDEFYSREQLLSVRYRNSR